MGDKFIPEGDQAFANMAAAFAGGIAANPALYMLSPADAQAISRAVQEYRNALDVLIDPTGRNAVTVAEKNGARIAAVQLIRLYANLIRPNQGISEPAKLNIGVRMRPTKLSRRIAPCSSPWLKFAGGDYGTHTIRYSDTETPHSKRKPFGARALQLFVAISEYGQPPESNPANARYLGEYGRSPILITHKFEDGGKCATYFARWIAARNEHGPWSHPISATIMGAAIRKSKPNSSDTFDEARGMKIAA